jgi:hypothetical protein
MILQVLHLIKKRCEMYALPYHRYEKDMPEAHTTAPQNQKRTPRI